MSTAVRLPLLAAPAKLQREVIPSTSRHVHLSLVHVPGPTHEIEPQPHLRMSFNIGPRFVIEASGPQGRQRFESARHSLMVIPADTTVLHEAGLPKPSGRPYVPVRLATFHVSTELAARAAMAMGLPAGQSHLEHQVVPPDEVVRGLASALLSELRGGGSDGPAVAESIALALVQRIHARQIRSGPSAIAGAMERVRMHIEDHLQDELGLDQLAAVAGQSVFHFCRVFRRQAGLTPHQYIVARRIELAKRLLWEQSGTSRPRSILDIALACGFASPSHFAMQFKKHTGRTPLQWQREPADAGFR